MYSYKVARIFLALLFVIVTTLQIFSFPGQFAHMRRVQGFSLILEISLTSIIACLFFSAQIAIFSFWKLIGYMERNEFFSMSSLHWINRIVNAFKVTRLFPVLLILIIAPQADDPGVLVLLVAITLFVCSLFVITALLRDQIRLKVT